MLTDCKSEGTLARTMTAKRPTKRITHRPTAGYDAVLTDVANLIEAARRATARSVNAVMTTAYWTIGRRIVVHEQQGAVRAEYGAELLRRLEQDLTGRGMDAAFQSRVQKRSSLD
jgi:hypothetical protein